MKKQPNSHKYIAGAAVVAVVASTIPTAGFAAEATKKFPDVTGHWAEAAINYLVQEGAIDGLPDGTFNPNGNIKRGEAAKILAKALGLTINDNAKASFADAKDHWASKYIAAIEGQTTNVINGKPDGTFAPDDLITRQDMAKMVVNAYPELVLNETANVEFTDQATYAKAQEAIQILASLGIVKGEAVDGKATGRFLPTANVTRAETATFVHRTEVEEVRVHDEVLTSGIAGFILSSDTRIKGATVTIGGKTVTTNEEGYFELLNVAPGTQEVTIQAEGYETVTSDVDVLEDEVTSFTKDMGALIDTSAIEISGVIVDSETGEPAVADVKIESYVAETDTWVSVAEVEANSVGAYTIDQTAASNALELGGEYRLTVTLDGYKDFVQSITLDDEEVVNALDGIQLDEIATIDVTGTVTNSEGTNVAAATVTINDAEGNVVDDVTVVNGAYKFEDLQLQSGTYNVVINDNTSAVSYTEFNVEEGTDVTHNVQLEEGNTINATFGADSVNDKFGTGAADTATYTLELLNGNTVVDSVSIPSVQTTEDAILEFGMTRVAPGDYTLRLSGDYVVTEEFGLNVDGDETPEERVTPAGTISGAISGTNDTPLVGAIVNLLDADGNIVASTKTMAEDEEAGQYEFTGVAAGDYTVEVSHNGYVSEETEEITVAKNNNTPVEVIALDAVDTNGDVEGFVRLTGSLSPVANATVTYYDADGDEKYEGTVKLDGSYSIADIEAGTYKVVVRGAGIDTLTTTQTIAGGDELTAVNYNLTTGGDASLTISVVDSEGNPIVITGSTAELLDASVDAVDPEAEASGSTVATGDGSTITFDNLSSGSFDLKIDVPEQYIDVDTTATLASGEELEIEMVLTEVADTQSVNFRIVDETNTNEENAHVVVFNEDGTIKHVLTTNGEGTASLALVDGNYTLAVIQDGYLVAERDVTVAGENVTVPVIQLSPIK